MKPGKHVSLPDLVAKIEADNALKRDVITSVKTLDVTPELKLVVPASASTPAREYAMQDYFQSQMAGHLNYPFAFWQRSRDQYPNEWRAMVKAMLENGSDLRLIRTMGDDARAYLSNQYRILDNEAIATAALSAVADSKGWKVESAEITDRKMFIKVVTETEREIRKGDIVRAGFILTNSEIGAGAVTVLPLVLRLVCMNGAVVNDAGMRRTHLTRAQLGDGTDAFEYFSDATKRLSDQALLSQIGDVIRKTVDETKFDLLLNKFREATEQKITGDVPEVVEVAAKRFGIGEGESQSILRNLINGADLSRYGMIQAVTATAQDEGIDYARSVELETIGGDLLNLPAKEWISISVAGRKN